MACCILFAVVIALLLSVRSALWRRANSNSSNVLKWRLYPRSEKMKQDNKPSFSFASRLSSIGYAVRGLRYTLRTQHNAWVHVFISILVIILGIALDISAADWRWLCLAIGTVWFAETVNTAFEFVCDVVSPEFNSAVARAKDIAAGAVLICASTAVVIGVITFQPYL